MENLTLTALIVPLLALLFNVYAYFHFVPQKKIEKKLFQRLWLAIISLSFVLNLAWEMLQMPLFKNMDLSWQSTLFCALASVADTLMVLLLFNVFALANKSFLWVYSISGKQILLLILIGGIGAVLAERRHVTAGSWAYSDAMPVIPIVEAGLSPVLQFILLPWLIFEIASRVVKK